MDKQDKSKPGKLGSTSKVSSTDAKHPRNCICRQSRPCNFDKKSIVCFCSRSYIQGINANSKYFTRWMTKRKKIKLRAIKMINLHLRNKNCWNKCTICVLISYVSFRFFYLMTESKQKNTWTYLFYRNSYSIAFQLDNVFIMLNVEFLVNKKT